MFLFSYWLRMQNPDLYHPFQGGEKPMDFSLLQRRAPKSNDLTQGPIDPWYAGGYLNYYWWGFFLAADATKLLGIVPEVAYNLAVPMFFALAAAATFSVGYNITEATRRFMRRRPDRTHIGMGGPIVVGLLAIFFVLIAGNLRGRRLPVPQLRRHQSVAFGHPAHRAGRRARRRLLGDHLRRCDVPGPHAHATTGGGRAVPSRSSRRPKTASRRSPSSRSGRSSSPTCTRI